MDARSRRHAAALGLSLAVATLPALATGPVGMHRFALSGRMEAKTATTLAGGGFVLLQSRLSKSREPALQSSGNFVLDAKLARSSLECTSNDIIFQNGFDTP